MEFSFSKLRILSLISGFLAIVLFGAFSPIDAFSDSCKWGVLEIQPNQSHSEIEELTRKFRVENQLDQVLYVVRGERGVATEGELAKFREVLGLIQRPLSGKFSPELQRNYLQKNGRHLLQTLNHFERQAGLGKPYAISESLQKSARLDQAVEEGKSISRIELLVDPIRAARSRIDLINEAKKEILMSYYILENDRTTTQGLSMLYKAMTDGRNVKVKIILDHLGNTADPAVLLALKNAGAEIYEYNRPTLGSFWKYSQRMHEKLFVVDGEHLITGDRNISSKYFGLTKMPFSSKDIYVQGPTVAGVAKDHIEELTKAKLMREWTPRRKISSEALSKATANLANPKRVFPDWLLDIGADWRNRLIPVADLEFLRDVPSISKTGRNAEVTGVASGILEALTNAKESIVIENPYIILTKEFQEVIEAKLLQKEPKKIKLTILTNSLNSQDVPIVAAQWELWRKRLGELGAEIYELPGATGPPRKGLRKVTGRLFGDRKRIDRSLSSSGSMGSLHSKVIRIDGDVSVISTYNLDPRSQKLNSENAVIVKDREFARRIDNAHAIELKEYHLVYSNGTRISDSPSCSLLLRALSNVIKSQL